MFRCVQILQTKMFVHSIALFEQTLKINIWSSMRKFFFSAFSYFLRLERLILRHKYHIWSHRGFVHLNVFCVHALLHWSFREMSKDILSIFISCCTQVAKLNTLHIEKRPHAVHFLTWSCNMTIPLPPLCHFAVRSGQVWLDSAKEICHTNVTNCM